MQKNRHTREQMYALIRKWENSNSAQRRFCKAHGICKSTFGYWRKQYLKEFGKQGSQGKFIPVKISDPPQHSGSISRAVELVYPNGVRLVCSPDMDLARLKPLIVL